MRNFSSRFIGAVVVIALFVSPSVSAASAKSVTVEGITISPAIINVSVDQNLLNSDFQVSIKNNTDKPASLSLSSLDFKSLNETGGIAFVGPGAKYGLANWLELPSGSIALKPGENKAVTIRVSNRADLSPGGHYAAVLFNKSSQTASGTDRINVNQVAAALVFLKKSGGEIYDLSLSRPAFGTAWLKLPSHLSLPVANTGNTQTVPRGSVTISGPFDHQVRRGIINDNSAMVLPGSVRQIDTSLFKTGHAWLPGRYTATIVYRSADTNAANIASYSFVYLTPLFIYLAAIFIGLVSYLYVRNYRSWNTPKKKKKTTKRKSYPHKTP